MGHASLPEKFEFAKAKLSPQCFTGDFAAGLVGAAAGLIEKFFQAVVESDRQDVGFHVRQCTAFGLQASTALETGGFWGKVDLQHVVAGK